MGETRIELTGWKAIAVAVIILGVTGYRIYSRLPTVNNATAARRFAHGWSRTTPAEGRKLWRDALPIIALVCRSSLWTYQTRSPWLNSSHFRHTDGAMPWSCDPKFQ
jgi:hypothetical protein